MDIKEKLDSNKIYFFSFVGVLIIFPWSLNLANYAIAVMVLAGLGTTPFSEKIQRIKKHREVFIFLIFYCLYVIGLLYTDNIFLGWKSVEKKFVMIIIPLLAASSITFTPYQRKWALLSFVCSIGLLTITCVVFNILTISRGEPQVNFDFYNLTRFNALHGDANQIWMQISYLGFSSPIINSPVSLSLYLSFCIVILLHIESGDAKLVWLKYVTITWFCVSIILLSSRMGIFILFAVGALNFLYFLLKKRLSLTYTLSAVTLSIALCVLILISPVTRFRVIEEPLNTSFTLPSSPAGWNSLNLHLLQWRSGIEASKQYGMKGTGTGGTISALQDYYTKADLGIFSKEYRVHNQFIETYLEIGILGFVALLLIFTAPIINAVKNKNIILISFMLIVLLACLSTPLLESGKDSTFYISIISLFLFTKNNDEYETR